MIELEQFTERARRALTLANVEARYLVTGRVEAVHLLFGVVQEAADLLEQLYGSESFALEPHRLRLRLKQELASRLQPGPWESEEMQLADEAQGALERAQQEARQANATAVDLIHLLAGLLGEPHSLAARVLTEAGLSLDRLRSAMAQASGGSSVSSER